jgi:hypothetical protein
MIRLRALVFEPGAYYLWLLVLPGNDSSPALRAPSPAGVLAASTLD